MRGSGSSPSGSSRLLSQPRSGSSAAPPRFAPWAPAFSGGSSGDPTLRASVSCVIAWHPPLSVPDRIPRGPIVSHEDRHPTCYRDRQGPFPYRSTAEDGWTGTSPVGSFPANGCHLVDLIGNVWEWTADRWAAQHPAAAASPCCVPVDPRSPNRGVERAQDALVVKGGSHLCAPEYCLRYRPAARQPQDRDTAATHIGFRCAADVG
nr:SUMF1/EgtB/PvdO family nonheme iron enzyme [Brevibacterium daeguense]